MVTSRSTAGREPLAQLASGFAQIATCVTQRASTATLTAAMAQAQALCGTLAGGDSAEVNALLANLHKALETWRNVWPQLGEQKDFRRAVAREAGLWSRRLASLAKKHS